MKNNTCFNIYLTRSSHGNTIDDNDRVKKSFIVSVVQSSFLRSLHYVNNAIQRHIINYSNHKLTKDPIDRTLNYGNIVLASTIN